VLAAGRPDAPRYRESLAALCQTYWLPLYVFLRRRGLDAHAAEDHTQAFFARLLEKHDLRRADPQRGRFRTFLLACLKNFVANELDKAQAQKRGGGRQALPLDFDNAESRYALEPAHDLTPEKLFDRQWAMTLLDLALSRLRAEAEQAGKLAPFERLSVLLADRAGHGAYAEAAAALGMTEGAARVAVHRLRRRYRDLLRDEVAQTVADPADVDGEIRDLMAALAR